MKNKTLRLSLLTLSICTLVISETAFGQIYQFTTAGKTGPTGPTQTELDSIYNIPGNPLNNNVISDSGIQIWEVPASGLYSVTAVGGMRMYLSSDISNRGANISGIFEFNQGDTLKILVGQAGGFLGGTGGTFIADGSNTPVMVAGGGGTLNYPNFSHLSAASLTQDGHSGVDTNLNVLSNQGINGNGGGMTPDSARSGGGGFYTNGQGPNAGMSFINGGFGSMSPGNYEGGFGGGSDAGAGGYSGGGGGKINNTTFPAGGGGGSYNSGFDQTANIEMNKTEGEVEIVYLGPVPNCMYPINQNEISVNHNSALIGWDFYDTATTTLMIEWDTMGFTPGTGNTSIVTGDSFLITSLNEFTNYEYYLTTICGSGDSSSIKGPFSFRTECFNPLSGTYTVNQNQSISSTNFNNLNQIIERLNECGVSDSVVFELAPGNHEVDFLLGHISGVSSTNTITFRGDTTGNNESVMEDTALTNKDYAFKLDSSAHVRFEGIHFTEGRSLNNFQYLVDVRNSSDIKFDNCTFTLLTEHRRILQFVNDSIYSAQNTVNDTTRVMNSKFNRCHEALRIASLKPQTEFEIHGNHFTDIHSGMLLTGNSGISVTNNILETDTAGNSLNAIRITQYSPRNGKRCVITGNQIFNFRGRAIRLSSSSGYDTTNTQTPQAQKGLIANNFLAYKTDGYYFPQIIDVTFTSGWNIIHNTLKASTLQPLRHHPPAILYMTSANDINIKNNIFYSNHKSRAGIFAFNNTFLSADVDYNNYVDQNFDTLGLQYGGGGNVWDVYNFNQSPFPQGLGENSHSVVPDFIDFFDYTITSNCITGEDLTHIVSEDIEGNPRSSNPVLGAFEPSGNLSANIGPLRMHPDPPMIDTGDFSPSISIMNFGASPLNSYDLSYEFNSGAVVTESESNISAASCDSIFHQFSSVEKVKLGRNTIKVYTANPNGLQDENTFNDTIEITFCPKLGGEYIVGNGGHFETLFEAVDAMRCGGIKDDVVFNLLPGTHYASVRIVDVTKTSPDLTITIKSETNNSNDVLVKDDTTVFEPFIIAASRTSGLIIKHLTFDNTRNNTLQFSRCSRVQVFRNEFLEANTNHISIGSFSYRVKVFDNTFFNSRTGIFINSAGSGSEGDSIHIFNNNFESFRREALRMNNGSYVSFMNNHIESDEDPEYGLRITNSNRNSAFIKNRIKLKSNDEVTGILIQNNKAGCEFRNNSIFIEEGSNPVPQGKNVAIKARDTRWLKLFHNTTHVSSFLKEFAALELEDIELHDFENNIFSGEGSGYPIYFIDTPNPPFNSVNHNNFYSTSGHVGYYNGVLSSVSELQNHFGTDSNSISVNPLFTDINYSTASLIPQSVNLDNAGTPMGIVYDIDSTLRSTLTPDIGAYEFTGSLIQEPRPGHSAGVLRIINPGHDSLICNDSNAVDLDIMNFGTTVLDSVLVYYAINQDTHSTWVYGPIDTLNQNLTHIQRVNLGKVLITDAGLVTIKAWTKLPNGFPETFHQNDTAVKQLDIRRIDLRVIQVREPVCSRDHTGEIEVNATYQPANYLWNTGSTDRTLRNLPAGKYSVTVTSNLTDCIEIERFELKGFEVDTSVTVDLPNLIANNDAPGVQYQWYDCERDEIVFWEESQIFTPLRNSSYAVIITQNGCNDTSACYTISHVSTNDLGKESNSIAVYPNPNTGDFTVEISGDTDQSGTIEIITSSGALIHSRTFQKHQKLKREFFRLNIAKGMYYIRTILDDEVHIQKLTVQ